MNKKYGKKYKKKGLRGQIAATEGERWLVPEWDGAGSNRIGFKSHVRGLEEVQIFGFLQWNIEFKSSKKGQKKSTSITTIINKTNEHGYYYNVDNNDHDEPVIFSKDNLSCAL